MGADILSREEEDLEGGCDNGALRDGWVCLAHCALDVDCIANEQVARLARG